MACVCFIGAALNRDWRNLNLIALGLFFFSLASFVQMFRAVV
jgi:hypothetical protein